MIDGLTIENRVAANKAIPDDVLEELKKVPRHPQGPDHDTTGRRPVAEY